MKLIGTCKINILSEALSPITHMMGVSGNESIINREKVLYNGSIVDVPVLSGNALRHKMIRETGSLYIVDQCGLRGRLTIDQANFMFTGGSLTESSTNDNIPIIAEMQKVSPLYRLLGGSLKNQIIGGSLFVSRGVLICQENKNIVSELCSDYELPDSDLLSAQHFVDKYQYTRGDASNQSGSSEIISDLECQDKKNLMIYSGEALVPGSMFYHDITLYNVSPLEVGAALHSLHLWQNSGGLVGGSTRVGHGRLKSSIWIDGLTDWFGTDRDPLELVVDYVDHVNSHTDEFAQWLESAFPGGKLK